uniref:ARF7EP_C domain-containing protein n=1 Tax=Ascaris lumbricoides TaxID=6252 RepID=A0A0M3HU89_ASCLU
MLSEVCASQYSPHHDENGDFVKQDGTKVKLCDCLRESCPGCHPECKHCGSRMCGPACQKGRDFVPLTIGCECDPTFVRYHPFLEKHKQCFSSCYPFST